MAAVGIQPHFGKELIHGAQGGRGQQGDGVLPGVHYGGRFSVIAFALPFWIWSGRRLWLRPGSIAEQFVGRTAVPVRRAVAPAGGLGELPFFRFAVPDDFDGGGGGAVRRFAAGGRSGGFQAEQAGVALGAPAGVVQVADAVLEGFGFFDQFLGGF